MSKNKKVEVPQWEPYELILTGKGSYLNPYGEVYVSGIFTTPSGKTMIMPGFYEGNGRWKIRIAPNEIGTWSYTTSLISKVKEQSGKFICIPSHHKGFLGISPQNPFSFCYNNGTPFFWLGDTAWYSTTRNVPFDGTFQAYIDKRMKQKFTVIQLHLAARKPDCWIFLPNDGKNEGGEYFIEGDKDYINPSYFRWVDKRIQYIVAKGLVPAIFLLWGDTISRFTPEQFRCYLLYVVARYAAYNIIWVLSGEWDIRTKQYPPDLTDNERKTRANLYKTYGRFLKAIDPYQHPITIHPGTPNRSQSSSEFFSEESWLDFNMQQTFRQVKVPFYNDIYTLAVADRKFGRPIVNGESHYEERSKSQPSSARCMQVRQNAWGCYMAGAYYTYGATGIWDWAYGLSLRPDLKWLKEKTIPWQKAVEYPGATQMTYLYNFFVNHTRYWRMNPQNDLVNTHNLCLADSGREYVIYMPEGGMLIFSLPKGNYVFDWFDPTTGKFLEQSKQITVEKESISFSSPLRENHDVVLHVRNEKFIKKLGRIPRSLGRG